MPTYLQINPKEADGKRTLERLLALRAHLDSEIPPRNLDKSILLATWNIREFDSNVYGERTPESFQYIAEIISRFDIVAIQEVRRNLKAMDKLIEILGKHWRYIFTDATEGRKGNNERMAFVYDSRKIQFAGLAGELVLPPIKVTPGKTFLHEASQPIGTYAFFMWVQIWLDYLHSRDCSHCIWQIQSRRSGTGGRNPADSQLPSPTYRS